MIELLSPAKDLEAGIAAIDYGADAVYIGGPAFSARQGAANKLEDIAKLVDYAHLFQVKVYVALNTLLKDEELEKAESLIHELYKNKVDAIIVQDMGILEFDLPPVALFASTQTTNITPRKVLFLQNCGFKRVILERALSLDDIRAIRAKTTVELECFVHGAICVSYSGQCFLSYALGGRSANRGQCAQPCRKSYSLEDGNGLTLLKNQPLLSLKDLNLVEHLSELIDAGVASFKIEGRMKDINYVKNITAFYRLKLDELIKTKIIQKSSKGSSSFNFTPAPSKTFNRGYTDYFLNEAANRLCAGVSGSLGQFLGNVAETKRNEFSLDTANTVIPGDGCCFIDENHEVQGFLVNKYENGIITPNKPMFFKKSTKIYRNFDKAFTKILSDSNLKRKLAISWHIKEMTNKLLITAIDEYSHKEEREIVLQDPIQKKSSDYEQRIKEVFEKIGHTSFVTTSVNIELAFQAFIPLSLLKQIRNEMLDILLLKIQKENNITLEAVPIKKNKEAHAIDIFDNSLHVLNKKTETFFQKNGIPVSSNAIELANLVPVTLPLMTTKYCILRENGLCLKDKNTKIDLPVFLKDEKIQLRLEFDCKQCEMKVYC